MKLLLDENLPHQLRGELPGHEIYTVAYMRWSGVENGELLRLAAEAGLDALITTDRGLEYERNLAELPIAVVVVLAKTNTLGAIRPLVPALLSALRQITRGQFVKVGQ